MEKHFSSQINDHRQVHARCGHAMDNIEQQLSSFAQSLSFADLDQEILHAIKLRFIDALGCALGAFNADSSQIARDIALSARSHDGSGIIGACEKSSPELAAFANTAMIRCLDLNDDYFGKDGPHPSDTIGAVLAVADSVHSDGKSFITGVAVAYEVLCTLADAVGLRDRGWDYVTFTALAAALGSAKLLKLSDEQIRNCLRVAAVANGALGQTRLGELSMWKGLASANACRNGVFACILASHGVTGPDLAFTGKQGMMAQISGPLDLANLGAPPLRAGIVYLKRWPVFYSAQTSVQAALELRDRVAVGDIEKLTVETYKRVLGRGASDPERWTPKSRETADHSVPFCVAAALLDGNITSATFDSRRFLDGDVVQLMSKVELREDPEFTKQYPEVWNCRITAETSRGERRLAHVKYPKGHPKAPFTDSEVEAKFTELAQPLLRVDRCRSFLDFAWHLEEARDIGELFKLLSL
jgi:2-methylcitrate dehydratase